MESIPPLPYYQFEVWFAGDDINDKQSALVSSFGIETAALNLNNFSIHSLWDAGTSTESYAICVDAKRIKDLI